MGEVSPCRGPKSNSPRSSSVVSCCRLLASLRHISEPRWYLQTASLWAALTQAHIRLGVPCRPVCPHQPERELLHVSAELADCKKAMPPGLVCDACVQLGERLTEKRRRRERMREARPSVMRASASVLQQPAHASWLGSLAGLRLVCSLCTRTSRTRRRKDASSRPPRCQGMATAAHLRLNLQHNMGSRRTCHCS